MSHENVEHESYSDEDDDTTGLTDRDEILIEALAHGHSYEQAGKAANYSTRTVSRRVEDPVFCDRLDQRKREISAEHVEQIRQLGMLQVTAAMRAQEVLIELLESDDAKIRLAVAKELYTGAAAKNIAYEQRLLRLEGRLEHPGDPRPPSEWSL